MCKLSWPILIAPILRKQKNENFDCRFQNLLKQNRVLRGRLQMNKEKNKETANDCCNADYCLVIIGILIVVNKKTKC